jgi:hypothetical protein
MGQAPTKSTTFDWMETGRTPAQAQHQSDRREAMYRAELEERAGLLHRLGQSREQARARLAANLDWDFQPGKSPLPATALDGIVDRVFGAAGARKNGPRKPAPDKAGGERPANDKPASDKPPNDKPGAPR